MNTLEFRNIFDILEEQFIAGTNLLSVSKRESLMDYVRYLLHLQEEEKKDS